MLCLQTIRNRGVHGPDIKDGESAIDRSDSFLDRFGVTQRVTIHAQQETDDQIRVLSQRAVHLANTRLGSDLILNDPWDYANDRRRRVRPGIIKERNFLTDRILVRKEPVHKVLVYDDDSRFT